MERDFKGIWIPKEIWQSKELTLQEKCFLVEIDSLDNKDGCFASNAYFADFFQLSKNRCTEVIKSLEKKGLLSIELVRENGKANITKRIIKVLDKSNRCTRDIDKPIREVEEMCSEKGEDNNIKTNNIKNIYIEQANNLWSLYPSKIGKDKAIKKIPQHIKDYGFEQMKKTIERYKEYVENNRNTGFNIRYQNGSTFFNSGFKDYLDENYKPEVKPVVSRYEPI